MKRNCIFIGFIILCLCVLALRLYSGDLSSFISGRYVAYDDKDKEYTPTLIAGAYERVDLDGGESAAREFIDRMSARVIKEEEVGSINIYYCYSPMLLKSVWVFDEEVNLMIAVSGSKVSIGTPLLKGSF